MKKIILLATAAVFWTLPSNIRAATQGTLGLTSIGSVTVTVTINQAMMISNLSDISFSYTPGAGTNQTPSVNVCVYTNTTAGTYYITATSANQSAGTFRVASAAPAYIPYTLQWYTQTGTAGTPTSLTSATKNTTAFTGANTTSSTCTAGASPSASFMLTFTAANLDAAAPGVYSDTLTLLLSAS